MPKPSTLCSDKTVFGCLFLLVIAAATGLAALVWVGSRPSTSNDRPLQPADAETAPQINQGVVDQLVQAEDADQPFRPSRDLEMLNENDAEEDVGPALTPQTVEAQPNIPVEQLEESTLEAVTTGTAVRWSLDGMAGYVVPSQPNEVGCVDYYFTVDSFADWKSDNQPYCPSE